MTDSVPEIVVVIPTLNEAAHIEAVVAALLADPVFATPGRAAIWVLDGRSTDGTRDIVSRLTANEPRVRLIDNPARIQAQAVNLAAGLAHAGGARALVRVDAHSVYPAGFVTGLVETLREQGAQSVVVPMRTVGGGRIRDAAADLFNSWLGNGGSPHRTGKVRAFVDHGHHAAFDLAAFMAAGGYDVRFVANEDAEFDKRLTKAGGRIFLENQLTIDYLPRNSFAGSWRQMWRNGRYRVWTAAKHGERLGLRQLLPVAVSLALLGGLLVGLVWPFALVIPIAYLALVGALALLAATAKTPGRVLRIVGLAVISHVAFGLGALRGLLDAVSGATPRLEAAR